ncbi:unnamed protein product [Allacma fusca]|uniref:Uncharacterized protein n=1 Tax=Allacma fusca TaxID=39272 RepID=A0A8J2LJK3_9HEXA|nr:unnamed protein product [Allacma fusca]
MSKAQWTSSPTTAGERSSPYLRWMTSEGLIGTLRVGLRNGNPSWIRNVRCNSDSTFRLQVSTQTSKDTGRIVSAGKLPILIQG